MSLSAPDIRPRAALGIESEAPAACSTVGAVSGHNVTPGPSAGVNWSGCNLTNTYVAGLVVSNAILSGASLTNADLPRAILPGANLTKASVSEVDLPTSGLTNTILLRANLTNADFSGSFGKPVIYTNTAYLNTTCADKSKVTSPRMCCDLVAFVSNVQR